MQLFVTLRLLRVRWQELSGVAGRAVVLAIAQPPLVVAGKESVPSSIEDSV